MNSQMWILFLALSLSFQMNHHLFLIFANAELAVWISSCLFFLSSSFELLVECFIFAAILSLSSFYCIDRHGKNQHRFLSSLSLFLLHSISLSSSFCSSSFSRILWVFTNWSCTVVLGVVVLMSLAYKIYVLLSVFLLLLLSVFFEQRKNNTFVFFLFLSVFFLGFILKTENLFDH